MGITSWLIMSSCAKFQKDSFIRSIVSRINVKRTFLSPEPLPDDFSKILLYGDMVNNGSYLCIEFHGRRPSCLWGVDSQRNHTSRRITASLTTLNNTWQRWNSTIKIYYMCPLRIFSNLYLCSNKFDTLMTIFLSNCIERFYERYYALIITQKAKFKKF